MYYLEAYDQNIKSMALTKCYSYALFHSLIENDMGSELTEKEKEEINCAMLDHGQCSYYLSGSDQTIRLLTRELLDNYF